MHWRKHLRRDRIGQRGRSEQTIRREAGKPGLGEPGWEGFETETRACWVGQRDGRPARAGGLQGGYSAGAKQRGKDRAGCGP